MRNAIFSINCLIALLMVTLLSSHPLGAKEKANSSIEAVTFLTDGVEDLPIRGLPGPIVSFSENSFPVVLGKYQDTYAPLVSAAFVLNGKVLAFGHTDYCNAEAILASNSSKRFFRNAILWSSGKSTQSPDNIIVAVWRDPKTSSAIKELGFNVITVNDFNDDFDVFIAGSVALNDQQYDKLFQRIEKGAGFITCGLGWGWSQINPNKDLVSDHVGNKNFTKYGVGIAWASDYLASTTNNNTFLVSKETVFNHSFVNGDTVLAFLKKLSRDTEDPQTLLNTQQQSDLNQISSTLSLIFPHLSQKQKTTVEELALSFSDNIVLTNESPALATDLLKRLVITIQTERYIHEQTSGRFAPEDVPALPTADSFPGKVPTNAKRLNDVSVMIKTSVPDWASTGLYAAPGETITIKVSKDQFSKFSIPFKVRIGSHSDSIKHHDTWSRYPEITLEKTIDSPETRIANPFGGLVYIVVPRNIANLGLGLVEFKISGAIAAPYFIRDVTSLDNWKQIRKNPAPWAEIQGNNVIVTVSSDVVRNLDNPQQLAETWDEILALEAEFAGGPYVRERPERICCDRQISAGYMHSGYPVMTHMDVKEDLVNNDRLRKEGDWGFYHEFGHNHQSSYWTFEGTGEVTVNYFTLYIMEKLNGRSAERSKADLTPQAQERMMKKYFHDGAKFEDWKQNPFLALLMTIQMRKKFGWEPFLRSVSEYRKAPVSELPKNDQDKRDQWMVRMSKNSGLNLGPFFTTWGIPISQEALDSVKDYPVWIPDELMEYNNIKTVR